MIILGMKIEDRSLIRGLGRRWTGIVKQSMLDMAAHWHRSIFPQHFGPSNRTLYQFQPRSQVYTKEIKPKAGVGVGRFRDEVLTGRSQRFMQAFVKITGTARKVTVRMNAPGYFTKPFIGTWIDEKTGETKRITRQPDKPDEVTRFSADDRRELREFMGERLQRRLQEARGAPVTTTIN